MYTAPKLLDRSCIQVLYGKRIFLLFSSGELVQEVARESPFCEPDLLLFTSGKVVGFYSPCPIWKIILHICFTVIATVVPRTFLESVVCSAAL